MPGQRTGQGLQEDYINFLASVAEVDAQTARRVLQEHNGDVTKAVDSLLAGDRAGEPDDNEMTRAIRQMSNTRTPLTSFKKSASQSSFLYQKCFLLRTKLLRIRGFTEHFPELTSSSDSTDPVAQLGDLFSMGTPLIYIFDQLPPEDGFRKFENYSLTKRDYEPNLDRAKKHAVALFVMQLRKLSGKIPECEMFTVTDLWNRDSTDGLVKVVNTVTAIVDYLPQDVFSDDEVSTVPMTDTNAPHDNIIREMLETERKYVKDLETMERLANALLQHNVDQETIHLLFPNLNQLVNLHRKFLIQLEFTAQQPSKVQRWGQPFIEYEEEFSIYEPYCVNYKNATRFMTGNALSVLNALINVKYELPALLLKPIQRVCQYPLLLDALAKALSNQGYDHRRELIRGSEAAKRVIDKINEAKRQEENKEIVRNLRDRVQDWKGHHIEMFGDLLLHDVFVVQKSDVDRVYATYLFSKILILCKVDRSHHKGSKKKMDIKDLLAITSATGITPLLLRGRIFMRNIVSATYIPTRSKTSSGHHSLFITWKADDGNETFTIKCARHEQMTQWQEGITRIMLSYQPTPPILSELPATLPLGHRFR